MLALEKKFPLWMPVITGTSGHCTGNNYIEILASRCNKAMELCKNNFSSPFIVRYEDFLADKEGTINKLASALGLDVRYDISEIRDKPFQPPGNPGISWQEFFGQRNLAVIEDICASNISWFGYARQKEKTLQDIS